MGLPFGLKFGWGLGSLGTASFLYTSNFLILAFMTTFLGIDPLLAGLLIGVAKVYDAFTDPLMGVISDKTKTRWGRRRPWLFLGALVCALSVYLTFSPPNMAWVMQYAAIYMLFVLLLSSTGYTIFNVPYISMSAELTEDYHERTNLMSYRVFMTSIGGLIGLSYVPSLLQEYADSPGVFGAAAYSAVAEHVGLIVLISMLVAFLSTSKARSTTSVSSSLSLTEKLKTLKNNKPFILLLCAKLFQLIGLATVTGSLFLLFKYAIVRPFSEVAYLGIAINVTLAVSMPIWLYWSKRFTKEKVYIAACVAYGLVTLTWLVATGEEPLMLFLLRAAALGFASGGVMLMGQALLPDCIEHDYHNTGLRREASLGGAYSFVEKTSNALGPVITGVVLSVFGFAETTGGQLVPQSDSAITGLMVCVAIIPALCSFISIPFLLKYPLSEALLEQGREQRKAIESQ